jgi:hypothetical protein
MLAVKIEHCGRQHRLQLESGEVALLIDILEAALPAEAISGVHTTNPSLSTFFNRIYSDLIDTARDVWQGDRVAG